MSKRSSRQSVIYLLLAIPKNSEQNPYRLRCTYEFGKKTGYKKEIVREILKEVRVRGLYQMAGADGVEPTTSRVRCSHLVTPEVALSRNLTGFILLLLYSIATTKC